MGEEIEPYAEDDFDVAEEAVTVNNNNNDNNKKNKNEGAASPTKNKTEEAAALADDAAVDELIFEDAREEARAQRRHLTREEDADGDMSAVDALLAREAGKGRRGTTVRSPAVAGQRTFVTVPRRQADPTAARTPLTSSIDPPHHHPMAWGRVEGPAAAAEWTIVQAEAEAPTEVVPSSRAGEEDEEDEDEVYSEVGAPACAPLPPPRQTANIAQRSEASKNAGEVRIGNVTLTAVQARLMGVGNREELMGTVDKLLAKKRPPKAPSRAKLHELSRPEAAKMSRSAREQLRLAGGEMPGDKLPRDRRGQKWATEKEARNCTFQPQLHSKAKEAAMKIYDFANRAPAEAAGAAPKDRAAAAAASDAFVERLDMKERQRRKKMDEERGRQAYAHFLGKKVCPKCGTVQSYDEVVEKKKACQFCDVLFCHRRPKDSKGLDAWLEDQQRWIDDRQKSRDLEYEQRLADQARAAVGGCDAATTTQAQDAYQRALRAKVDAEAGPFFDRLKDDIDRRRAKVAAATDAANNNNALGGTTGAFRPNMPGLNKVADFHLKKRTKPIAKPDEDQVSKWEDDLEEYLKGVSADRHATKFDRLAQVTTSPTQTTHPGHRSKSPTKSRSHSPVKKKNMHATQ